MTKLSREARKRAIDLGRKNGIGYAGMASTVLKTPEGGYDIVKRASTDNYILGFEEGYAFRDGELKARKVLNPDKKRGVEKDIGREVMRKNNKAIAESVDKAVTSETGEKKEE